MPTTQPQPDPATPRVLLFGHRGAGKSALLGALFQAGETQGETLRAEVVPSSVDLPRIRDALYSHGKLESSHTELASFTLRLRPRPTNTQPAPEPLTVVIDDCSGKAAESLLAHPEPITQRAPDSPVARAVVECDAIMLLVDASSTPEELAEAFEEFDTFLTVVGQAKTDARAVGGFPVFLVLTQCDRLAQPGDTLTVWEARVSDRAEYAWKAFDAYLKDADPDDGIPSPFLPFGSVDLTVVAVAIRKPPLSDAPEPGNVPYHIAELFRDCFSGAASHRKRVRESDRRLKWTVRFVLTAVVVMLLGLATFALFPPQSTGPALAEKIEDYRLHEPPAAVRLADGHIERNERVLAGFAKDSEFPNLPPDLRAFVESRRKEIDDYQEYRAKLANTPAPISARSLPDLARIQHSLRTELALPNEYNWERTAAAELRGKWLADINAITAAQAALVERYRDLDRRTIAMALKRSFDGNWKSDLDALVAEGNKTPFPLNDPIPNSPALNQPRGEAVPYRVPLEFDEVHKAKRYWEQTRDQVLHLGDLAEALGMTGGAEGVVMIPEPGPGIDSASLASARWTALVRAYRRQSEGYPEWEVRNFPDPGRTELARRLRASFDNGVKHVRALLLAKLGPNPSANDTPSGWESLANALSEPTFRAWGQLLHLLARLLDPAAPDPITEFAHFLQQKTFELDLREFELTIPLDLSIDRVEPTGSFTVTVTHGNDPPQLMKFAVGKGVTQDRVMVYRLTSEGNTKLLYRPGDDLRAELPVKVGARELKLLWETGGSNTFRFERLSRDPQLTKPGGGTETATGVRLLPTGSTNIPKFPALFPLAK
ncbi:MAG: hypothetical protein L0241_08025 [Planctomycetia bacterium]|nr:hypothetical protein [Planctomycetia bacterium]